MGDQDVHESSQNQGNVAERVFDWEKHVKIDKADALKIACYVLDEW